MQVAQNSFHELRREGKEACNFTIAVADVCLSYCYMYLLMERKFEANTC